jgi:hypothetical protein
MREFQPSSQLLIEFYSAVFLQKFHLLKDGRLADVELL